MSRRKFAVNYKLSRKLMLGCSSIGLMAAAPFAAQAATAAPAATLLPEAAAAAPDTNSAVAQVVVTGSRLVTGFTAPTPVAVVGQAQIATRGAVNISDAVQEIPAFRPAGQGQGQTGTFATGQSLLDLRNLGRTRTLVLVDGRRPTPNNSDGTFDTNMLPTSLVDRTEVVTGGASAAYGSDAVAGVVNFVLKDHLDGFTGAAQYGVSKYGDTRSRAVNFGFGRTFDDGRIRFMVGADMSKDDPSPSMSGRPWGQSEPGMVALTATRPAGVPANVIGNNVEYEISPGSLITSCVRGTTTLAGSACPLSNTTFNAGGQPIPLPVGPLLGTTLMVSPVANGPNYGYSLGNIAFMKVGGQRANFLARLSYEVTPNTTVFATFSYGSFKEHSQASYYAVTNNTLLINRDNPYIPSALAAQMDANGITQLKMNRLNGDFGIGGPSNLNFFNQGELGAKGTVFGGWKWDASIIYGTSQFRYDNFGVDLINNYMASAYAVKDPTSGNIVCGPMATNPNRVNLTAAQIATISAGCVPFNPFGPTSMSLAAYNYISPEVMNYTRYHRNSAQVNVSGSPFNLPAGPVSLAVGAEWHADGLNISVPLQIEARTAVNDQYYVNNRSGAGHNSAKEVYGEIGIPVVKDVPFFQKLDLNGAFRHTEYTPSGPVNTWKLGATWDVSDFLRFRGTRSRDIRAPNITELFVNGNDSFGQRTNPVTGVSAQLNGASVNNPNLKPEIADTTTGGFILQPTSGPLNGLRASIDYWDIQVAGIIAAVAYPDVLTRCLVQKDPAYCNYVTFDNSAIGFSRVDSPLFNQNSLKTNGVDFNIVYRAPQNFLNTPGRFTLNVNATYLAHLETKGSNGVPLNNGDIAPYAVRWKSTINLTWDLGRFSNYIQVRTTSSMKYSVNYIGPDAAGYSPSLANSINKNKFPAMGYTSYGAQYDIINTDGRRLQLYGIIDNVFNKAPPGGFFGVTSGLATGGTGAYNPYDSIGRYYKMGVRFTY